MSTDDAAGLLETEQFHILSQVTNENDQVLQKGVSSVSMCMSCNDGTGIMKNSNRNDENSLQDVVECVDFLDTIELNDDENSVGVDLDA
eukprot:8858115-Ditylum_brightwellii.AAC.1